MTRPARRSAMLPVIAALGLAAAVLTLVLGAADPRLPDLLFGAWRLRHVMLAGALTVLAAACLATWLGRTVALVFWSGTLSALLLLAALEGAGRTGLINWDAPAGAAQDGTGAPGWTLAPGVAIEGETYQDIATLFGIPHDPIPFAYATDEYGFRNAAGEAAGAGIILLGDSIVLGAQVPRGQTIDSVVETATGRPAAQAALLGLSIQEQHDMLRGAGLPLEGKQIVQFLFEGNDLLDSRAFRRSGGTRQATDPAGTGDEAKAGGGSFIKQLWGPLVRRSNPPARYAGCEIGDQEYLFLWTRKSFDGVRDEFDAIAEAILTFRDEVEEAGARYALVFVPTKYRVLQPSCAFPEGSLIANPEEQLSDLPDAFATWARASGIAHLDLTGPLQQAAAEGTYSWFWGDTHWTAEGHAVAGRAVARWLEGLR